MRGVKASIGIAAADRRLGERVVCAGCAMDRRPLFWVLAERVVGNGGAPGEEPRCEPCIVGSARDLSIGERVVCAGCRVMDGRPLFWALVRRAAGSADGTGPPARHEPWCRAAHPVRRDIREELARAA